MQLRESGLEPAPQSERRHAGRSGRSTKGAARREIKDGAGERTNLEPNLASSSSPRGRPTKSGAPEGNNLEPFECAALLSELETWTEILKADPEVIHKLEALALGDNSACEDASDAEVQVSQPDLPDPSP